MNCTRQGFMKGLAAMLALPLAAMAHKGAVKAETTAQEPLKGLAWEAVEFETRIDNNGSLWARLVDSDRWLMRFPGSESYWSYKGGDPADLDYGWGSRMKYHIPADAGGSDYDLSVLAYLRGYEHPGGYRFVKCGASGLAG